MKIQIISNIRVYDGFFKVNQIKCKHSLYQGGNSPVIKRELLCQGQQGCVLFLYDLKKKIVILIEQCRIGALADEDGDHWLIEPVAGRIEPNESAAETCIREAKEEAGICLDIQNLEFIYKYYPSPGGYAEVLHLYAAEADADQFGDYGGIMNDIEDIKILKIPFAKAYEDLKAKKYKVASTYIALQWLFLFKISRQ
jgi:ADP-ribose pyrophosphatase